MRIDPKKLHRMATLPGRRAVRGELRREDQVLFVSAELPVQLTLETAFESDCQKPLDLFRFSLGEPEGFSGAEELVRQFKKNFTGHIIGRFESMPSPTIIDRAYAAGLDLLEIPLGARTPQDLLPEQLKTLDYARSVFPAWAVTLVLDTAADPGLAELLLRHGLMPVVLLESDFSGTSTESLVQLFSHLARGWKKHKVSLKPLLPLLDLATPLTPPPKRRGFSGLIERIDDARLRTVSDLRRQLRVREVAASFESAGL